MEEKNYTKDLGCAGFLYASNYPLKEALRDPETKLFKFIFTQPEKYPPISKAVEAYYNNNPIKGLAFWQAIKTLKTIIHEKR